MTSRSYCFTVNNPTYSPEQLPEFGRYAILAKEFGEKEKTAHIQGYIEFTRPVRMRHIKNWLKAEAHCEIRRGTRDQAREYCMKEDTEPLELGNWIRSPGKRTDINQLFNDCITLPTLSEIALKHEGVYLKYYKAVQHVRTLTALDPPDFRPDLKVSLFYGPPGSGKTRAAYAFDPNLYALPLGKNLWMDGYTGQKTVLLDDYNGEMKLVDLLRFLDLYPIQYPVKGGFIWLHATQIIITSNSRMEYWYDYNTRQDSLAALERRIHEVKEFPYEADTLSQSSSSEEESVAHLPSGLAYSLDLTCDEQLEFN